MTTRRRQFAAPAVDLSSDDEELLSSPETSSDEHLPDATATTTDDAIKSPTTHGRMDPYSLQRGMGLDAMRLRRMKAVFSMSPGVPKASQQQGGKAGQVAAAAAAAVTGRRVEESDERARSSAMMSVQGFRRGISSPFRVPPPRAEVLVPSAPLPAPMGASEEVVDVPRQLPGSRLADMQLERELAAAEAELDSQLPDVLSARSTRRGLGLEMRGSFRVGWGPGSTFVRVVNGTTVVLQGVSLAVSPVDETVEEDADGDAAMSVVSAQAPSTPWRPKSRRQKTSAFGARVQQVEMSLKAHLAHHHHATGAHSSQSTLTRLVQSYLRTLEQCPSKSATTTLQESVWRLVLALWSPEMGAPLLQPSHSVRPAQADDSDDADMEDASLSPFEEEFARNAAVSSWLRETVTPEVHDVVSELRSRDDAAREAFELLSGHLVASSCEAASRAGDFNLAMLLAQAGQGPSLPLLLKHQVSQWIRSGVWEMFDKTHQLLYLTLRGNVADVCGDPSAGLSWLRQFGLFLWYSQHGFAGPSAASYRPGIPSHLPQRSLVARVLREYSGAFQQRELGVSPPHPPFLRHVRGMHDIRYGLLSLYCDRTYRQSLVLSPEASSVSTLDFELAWYLLDALEYTDCEEFSGEVKVYMGFIAQLDLMGLWHWAIYVASHAAKHLRLGRVFPYETITRELLARNCPPSLPTRVGAGSRPRGANFPKTMATGPKSEHALSFFEGSARRVTAPATARLGEQQVALEAAHEEHKRVEAFLVHEVGVPERWIYEARAQRARYDRCAEAEFEFSMRAGMWNEAHDVLVSELAPQYVLAECLGTLSEDLSKLSAHAAVVQNWHAGGDLYLKFHQLRERGDRLLNSAKQPPARLAGNVEELIDGIQGWLKRMASRELSNSVLDRAACSEMTVKMAAWLEQLTELHHSLQYDESETASTPAPAPVFDVPVSMTENHRLDFLHEMTVSFVEQWSAEQQDE